MAALAACADTGTAPVAPTGTTDAPSLDLRLTCAADVRSGMVQCGDPGFSGGASAVIVGNQNTYIRLSSSNAAQVADTFGVDVTVTNLIPQPLGTTNGSTADPGGVRVFFQSGPSSTTGGVVTVANPDGTGVFTDGDQPYHQYNGMLAQDSTSGVKRWKFHLTPEVKRFTFTVLVSAAVQYPEGYIDNTPYVLSLDPGETRVLGGTVRNFVGEALSAPISWSTSAPAIAAISGAQVTAGASKGFAELTATSGGRPGVYTTAVSVCQSAVVTSGTTLPASISASDCFSSYGSNNGRPTTSYYADLYRVSLTAGQTLTVTMDSGNDLDTYLLLAGLTDGFLVAGNDDDEEEILGRGSRVVYTAPATGVYVIEASTFNGLDTGGYTLGVTIS